MPSSPEDSETDGGPRAGPKRTARLCIATREVRPIDDLIRFVIGPDGGVVPDLKRRLPGRGVWVSARRENVDEAVRRNAFARSFKQAVRAPADLAALTEQLLEKSVLDALSIAHKAGMVEIGFARVEDSLVKHDIAALIHASEASSDGIRKLAGAVRRRYGDAPGPPIIATLTTAQLDLALGRSNVIHAALLAGAASEGLLARLSALQRFRGVTATGGNCGS
ncbi:MAG: RNA-binding protein [Rhizobiales bacterium]|nr:RNA-binding protein [Hyphomicrobiales bacterium]